MNIEEICSLANDIAEATKRGAGNYCLTTREIYCDGCQYYKGEDTPIIMDKTLPGQSICDVCRSHYEQ